MPEARVSTFPSLPRVLENASVDGGVHVVVTAVDSNPRFAGAAAWWLRFWITAGARSFPPTIPILINMDGTTNDIPIEFLDNVVNFKVPAGVNTAFASQVIRLLWPGTLPESVRTVTTTDVDMFALSIDFLSKAQSADEGSFTVNRNVLQHEGEFPICYLSASPSVWREVMKQGPDLEDELLQIWNSTGGSTGEHGGIGWSIDQKLVYNNLEIWDQNGGSLTLLTDRDTKYRRLDRRWPIQYAAITSLASYKGYWSSYHAHLPPNQHENLLAWLLWLSQRWKQRK